MKRVPILIALLLACNFMVAQECLHDSNNNGIIDGEDLLNLLTMFGIECVNHIELSPIITEIHYNPSELQGLDSEWEFIEIYNPNSSDLNLSNWYVYDGVYTQIPVNTFIEPHGFLVISKEYNSYAGDLPSGSVLIELNPNSDLDNSGEILRLYNEDDEIKDFVHYLDITPWPLDADGFGASLELINSTIDNSLPSSWQISLMFGGSPGTINSSW